MKTITLLVGVLLIYYGFSGKWKNVIAATKGK